MVMEVVPFVFGTDEHHYMFMMVVFVEQSYLYSLFLRLVQVTPPLDACVVDPWPWG